MFLTARIHIHHDTRPLKTILVILPPLQGAGSLSGLQKHYWISQCFAKVKVRNTKKQKNKNKTKKKDTGSIDGSTRTQMIT